jgi:hypothetical protein
MAQVWLLKARVSELEHAFNDAIKHNEMEMARHWNQELIKALLELLHVQGHPERTSEPNGGIEPRA